MNKEKWCLCVNDDYTLITIHIFQEVPVFLSDIQYILYSTANPCFYGPCYTDIILAYRAYHTALKINILIEDK